MTIDLARPDAGPDTVGPRTWAGLTTVAYAAVQLDGALVTAAYGDSSPVSDDRLSFPWDGATV